MGSRAIGRPGATERAAACAVIVLATACGDRAPPALWPEPPPPTLAEPIGVGDTTGDRDPEPTRATEPATEPAPAGDESGAQPAPPPEPDAKAEPAADAKAPPKAPAGTPPTEPSARAREPR